MEGTLEVNQAIPSMPLLHLHVYEGVHHKIPTALNISGRLYEEATRPWLDILQGFAEEVV